MSSIDIFMVVQTVLNILFVWRLKSMPKGPIGDMGPIGAMGMMGEPGECKCKCKTDG